MTRLWAMFPLLIVVATPGCTREADRRHTSSLAALESRIAQAQRQHDLPAVRSIVAQAIQILGPHAGVPEISDEFRTIPRDASGLLRHELDAAFLPYVTRIDRERWWHIGLDPTATPHALREVANVIMACVAIAEINADLRDQLTMMARDGGDFLLWAQARGGRGVIPFPAYRNGPGAHFQAAERFFRAAEQAGLLDQVIHNGWAVEDFGDGGLKFDNGLGGVALLRLYEWTGDERYLDGGLDAALWAAGRPAVPNWNYNAFSVYVLAEAYRVTGVPELLDAALDHALIGVLPGQLRNGPHAGRWFDPHNARPPYHYIMVKALTALRLVLPDQDPASDLLNAALRAALRARNIDYKRGIVNVDQALEALTLVRSLPPTKRAAIGDAHTTVALDALDRYATHRFRRGEFPAGPQAWAALISLRARSMEPMVFAPAPEPH